MAKKFELKKWIYGMNQTPSKNQNHQGNLIPYLCATRIHYDES